MTQSNEKQEQQLYRMIQLVYMVLICIGMSAQTYICILKFLKLISIYSVPHSTLTDHLKKESHLFPRYQEK